MKKNLFAYAILAASLFAVSCQNNDELANDTTTKDPSTVPLVISAVANAVGTPATRAEMAYKYDLLWSAGDQIYLKTNSANTTATLQDGAGTAAGTFSCTSNPFNQGDEVEAIYPTSLVDGERLVWPTDQSINTIVPMYCKETLSDTGNQNFAFTSLGCVLQIVYNPHINGWHILKSIKIEDGEKTMSGTFTIDNEGKAVITAQHKAGITLDLGPSGVQLQDEKVGFFNIVVPAGTYSHLKLTFTDYYGEEYVMTSSSALTFRHNAVAKLTLSVDDSFFHNKKYGTGTTKAIIDGDPVDVEWVQLWYNGPKFAKYNVGVTDGKAESFGGLYLWGSTIDRDSDDNNYYKTGRDLTGNDDTATALWGSNWRMPTGQELQYLQRNCKVEQVDVNGVKCLKVYGVGSPDYELNFIYLPFAGMTYEGKYYADGVEYDKWYHLKSSGSYWASDGINTYDAYHISLEKDTEEDTYFIRHSTQDRSYGCSVRAVLK